MIIYTVAIPLTMNNQIHDVIVHDMIMDKEFRRSAQAEGLLRGGAIAYLCYTC